MGGGACLKQVVSFNKQIFAIVSELGIFVVLNIFRVFTCSGRTGFQSDAFNYTKIIHKICIWHNQNFMEKLEIMTDCNASFTAVLVHSYMTSAGPTSPAIYFPKNDTSQEYDKALYLFWNVCNTLIQGEHKFFPWLQIFITRKLRGIQTYFFTIT